MGMQAQVFSALLAQACLGGCAATNGDCMTEVAVIVPVSLAYIYIIMA